MIEIVKYHGERGDKNQVGCPKARLLGHPLCI